MDSVIHLLNNWGLLLNFLTHGAPLRVPRAREGSATNFPLRIQKNSRLHCDTPVKADWLSKSYLKWQTWTFCLQKSTSKILKKEELLVKHSHPTEDIMRHRTSSFWKLSVSSDYGKSPLESNDGLNGIRVKGRPIRKIKLRIQNKKYWSDTWGRDLELNSKLSPSDFCVYGRGIKNDHFAPLFYS